MNVSVTAHVNTGAPTVSVPSRSIFRQGEPEQVFTIDADGIVSARRVKVLEIRSDGTARIDSDELSGQDLVITSGISRIKEGDKVRPLSSPEASNIGGLL